MTDKKPEESVASQAVDAFDVEQKLLLDIEKSADQLENASKKLAEAENKVFTIFNAELDATEIDAKGNEVFKMSAVDAATAYAKLSDATLKRHKLRLELINALHGVRKDGEAEVGDDLTDNVYSDLPDSVRRGAAKALSAYFKGAQPHRKYKKGEREKKRPQV